MSQDCDKTKEDCKKRDLLRKIACRSARQYEEMIGNLENSGKKEKEREERALEMELKSIHTQMQELKAKITLPEDLFDAMGELKALGNDAAHIDAKDYADIGEEEAKDSIELAKEILKSRYQYKNLVDRLRARKKKP